MRVCHLTSVHSHTDTRIFIKECKALVEAGYEVHLVAPGAPSSVIDGVHVHGIVKETGGRVKRMTKTVKHVFKKGLSIDADVYHFHDPELIPTGLKLKKMKKKVIYDVHEDLPRDIMSKHWIRPIFRKLIANLFERYENKSSKKFDLVCTSTPFIKDRFKSIGCNAVVIHNYPLLNESKTIKSAWLDKEDVVCYVGGITFVRGINEMVQSLPLTNSKVELLLGGTFASMKESEASKKLDGWGHVRELGYLNREEVYETYKRSKAGLVVLHPINSYIESLPIKMFEYMSSGIPVICSNFPLWANIIKDNKCGICINPLNPRELASAIDYIIEHPEEAYRMGLNGRAAVEKYFNWEAESKRLVSAYERLLK
ncbi:glycosyltransferase WbpH [Sporosarcina sp. NCCP-2222]|uniref:glycosyltransferase family 4 protein n=1 Tax=Sporosarcina sp. NCCP-2222 TaxID=2935073 RepID=UPI002084D2B5|nr:glycosyltransferase family 4 protein [Sporosarcina sp. NCCP-2222]GKV57401.1 glycosyltransferase WbpH [Sporosarcina sp. NCCP-2222]